MKYRNTLLGLIVCIFLCAILYWYFESPSHAMEQEPITEEIVVTKYDYTVKKLSKNTVTGELEIHFLDVGQAESTLIICDGQVMLIDTGMDDQGTKIQYYLKQRGIDRLDYLVLTHPDIDHIGSADVIITKFDIGTIFMSDYEKETKNYLHLSGLMEERQIIYFTPAVGNVYSLGEASFQILGPNDDYEESNDASITLMLTHGNNKFLFTGDAEAIAEKDMLNNGLSLEADLYHVGHHGSKTSTTEEFLNAIMPTYAVISCGENNPYGLPDAEVLNSLRTRNIKVFRTDEQGTIVATSDGKTITFNCAPSETWQAGE